MRKFFRVMLASLVSITSVTAQVAQPLRQLVVPELDVFIPHWFLTVQGGVGYDLGEDDFGRLLTPAFQVRGGYQFNKTLSLQAAVNGAWAKGRYSYPEARYSWNFIQPTLELRCDLPALFGLWSMDNVFNPYILFGGGFSYTWGNDEANKAEQHPFIHFEKLWSDYRWNPVLKGAIGADFRVSQRLSINVEVNSAMLPDHFNSKRGQHDNRDWHFNALVGLHIDLTEPARRSEPLWEYNQPVIYEPIPEPEQPDTVLDVYNIQFEINKSVIRTSQIGKLTKILEFMRNNPKAKIQLTGYADKETGNAVINDRLSRERVQVVSSYLVERGLDEARIRRRARGDRVQPYDIPEDNRVTICVIYELIDPESHY